MSSCVATQHGHSFDGCDNTKTHLAPLRHSMAQQNYFIQLGPTGLKSVYDQWNCPLEPSRVPFVKEYPGICGCQGSTKFLFEENLRIPRVCVISRVYVYPQIQWLINNEKITILWAHPPRLNVDSKRGCPFEKDQRTASAQPYLAVRPASFIEKSSLQNNIQIILHQLGISSTNSCRKLPQMGQLFYNQANWGLK